MILSNRNPRRMIKSILATSQVRRLEYIISQSTKQALAGERKTAQEMHALTRKMDALKSLYLRLDRALQGLNGSASQKQKKRDMSPPVSPPPPPLPSQNTASSASSSSERGKMGGRNVHFQDVNQESTKKAAGDDEGQLDPPSKLKTQVNQLKTMNKSLQLEVENLAKERQSIVLEFTDVKRDRDQSKKRIASLEDQVTKLEQTIEKLRREPHNDEETQSSDDDDDEEHKALVNFQRKKHIQAFKTFISRPRIVEVRQKKPGLLCRLLRRKKRRSVELVEEK